MNVVKWFAILVVAWWVNHGLAHDVAVTSIDDAQVSMRLRTEGVLSAKGHPSAPAMCEAQLSATRDSDGSVVVQGTAFCSAKGWGTVSSQFAPSVFVFDLEHEVEAVTKDSFYRAVLPAVAIQENKTFFVLLVPPVTMHGVSFVMESKLLSLPRYWQAERLMK